jgi:hypothetical protein
MDQGAPHKYKKEVSQIRFERRFYRLELKSFVPLSNLFRGERRCQLLLKLPGLNQESTQRAVTIKTAQGFTETQI